MGYLRRRVITAALTANAVRPFPGQWPGAWAFPASWIAGELAPQLLAATVADTAVSALRRRVTLPGLALAAATTYGLVRIIRQSSQVRVLVDGCISHDLGDELAADLDPVTPEELATPWNRLATPFRRTDPRVRVERNLRYSDAGKRGLLDIYLPARRDLHDAPVLLQVHGGGWTLGSKDEQGVPLMNELAADGWVCVAINYRLAPRDAFPAQIIDVKRAIAWVKEHIADYGGDPTYIVLTGGSAGGHLTALAALTPNDPEYQPGFEDADTTVQAVVPHYGVYDVAGSTGLRSAITMRDSFFAPRIMQRTWEEAPELFEHASPILRITPDAPDFFVIHGERDTLVSVDQARLFVADLRATSHNTVVYAEIPGAQHAFDVFTSIRSAHVVRAIHRYLIWHHTHRRVVTDMASTG